MKSRINPRMTLVVAVIAVFSCGVCSAAQAAQSTPAIQALMHFYNQVNTLRTDFHQVQIGSQGKVIRKADGVFLLDRPGRFRWNYEKPYKQSIISDGETLWIYDQGLKQVIVRSVNQTLKGTPAQLLSGGKGLRKSFEVKSQGKQDGLLWVRLTPKSDDSDFKRVRLGFSNNRPQRMILKDRLGQTTRIAFSNTEVNIALDPVHFDFTPPEGTEVVKHAAE